MDTGDLNKPEYFRSRDFSLVLGGPLFQILRRSHLSGDALELLLQRVIAVRCGPLAPENPYVSVKYRNQWFWIEDRDLRSKQIFNFLMFMFSLTETGGA